MNSYFGKAWNTDMETMGRGYRVCPACGEEVYVERIMAYEDGEQWTCPRGACGARNFLKAERGRYGTRVVPDHSVKDDRTKGLSDFKRNNPRQYRSKKWRRENEE